MTKSLVSVVARMRGLRERQDGVYCSTGVRDVSQVPYGVPVNTSTSHNPPRTLRSSKASVRQLLLAATAASLVVLPLQAQLSVSYTPTSLEVRGTSLGGRVMVYGVAQQSHEGSARIVRRRFLLDSDSTGLARADLQEPVPFQSLWFVMDLRTGSYVVSTPPEYHPLVMNVPMTQRRPGADADWIIQGRPFIYVCLARPGVGAWDGQAVDGREDADGMINGAAAVALDRLRALDKTQPVPLHLARRDVLFLVDPDWMRYAVVQLSGDPNAQ